MIRLTINNVVYINKLSFLNFVEPVNTFIE